MSTLIQQRGLNRLNRIFAWLVRWRHWVLGSIGLAIVVAEFSEHPLSFSQFDSIYFGEIILFIFFLLIIVVLLETTIRAEQRKNHANNILNYKHLLAQQLSDVEGWHDLTNRLYEFMGTLAPNTMVDLLIPAQDSKDLEIYSSRESGDAVPAKAELREVSAHCQECCLLGKNTFHAMQSCEASQALYPEDSVNRYCLSVDFGNVQAAFLWLYFAPGSSLSSDQLDILNNISPEISLAMKIVQHRIALSEHLVFKTADSTRREISHDLHDTLGQSLSYLRLKLEQFINNDPPLDFAEIRADLSRMHATASESLQLLRETLAVLQSESQSHLANNLHQHGKSVGERANFDLQFNTTGTPLPLTSSTMRQIFYVYREALNNIERHACADRVEVRLDWGVSALHILIADNGKGFNPEYVQNDQHYGIKIMQERMAALNGSVCIESSEGAGTRLTINLPFVA